MSVRDKGDDAAVDLEVIAVVPEALDVVTLRLDNAAGRFAPHRAGQHLKVCVDLDGVATWRGFSISSPPTRPDVVEITVKRRPGGTVSAALHARKAGGTLRVKGPSGRFAYDPESHREPIVVLAAGMGITPAIAILETLADPRRATLLYGVRNPADILFDARIGRMIGMKIVRTLTRPDGAWRGEVGRVDPAMVARYVDDPSSARYFVCGPGTMIDDFTKWLTAIGVAPELIHAERFGKPRRD